MVIAKLNWAGDALRISDQLSDFRSISDQYGLGIAGSILQIRYLKFRGRP